MTKVCKISGLRRSGDADDAPGMTRRKLLGICAGSAGAALLVPMAASLTNGARSDLVLIDGWILSASDVRPGRTPIHLDDD